MRIYKNELIRFWKTPGIIISVILACLVTFGVLNVQSKEKLIITQPSDYKAAFDNLEGMSVEKAYTLYMDMEDDRMDFSTRAFLNKAVKNDCLPAHLRFL